ncbi:unnamed protein product [Onchocerca ochengi]|uniref:DRBM domain-containing protein n=1 Tax=Onchocerca ochengi TaxID=42157 RepID=A0A182E4H7_ONCOC|nr:unnamed protein product [Onchocerca ochengi]
MADFANSELNHRLRLLHFRHGKITVSSMQEAIKYLSRRDFVDLRYDEWIADTCILFGDKDPMNITGMLQYNFIVAITSRKDHLKVEWNFDKINEFASNDGEGTLINGMIYPCDCIPCGEFPVSCLSVEDIKDSRFHPSVYKTLIFSKNQVKLAIVISGSGQSTKEKAENRALMTAQILRLDLGDMPICIVAQSDTRKNEKANLINKLEEDVVLLFYYHEISASTFVVDTKDEEILRKKFLEWKEKLNFLNSHQTFAFHFTMINGTEPENSEEIFGDTFPNIPLNTLRLLSDQSITGVDYRDHYKIGPVYAIVGLLKFGSEEDFSE